MPQFAPRRPRPGFTLIELLVVIAIIGVLIALLSPAVQHAREAARKTECRDHLKQLAVALHSYESAHRVLPPGYVYRPADGAPPVPNAAGFGWGAMLLPFVDQGNIYATFDWNMPIYSTANEAARETRLPLFLCPTDSVSPRGYVRMGPAPERYAMASFVASFGPPDLDADQEQRFGLFSRNSSTMFAHVTDGLSHTLMIGERQNGPFRNGASHGNHFDYETTWCGAVRDWDEPDDDHGHMVLFQSGHVPNDPRSDDRDVSAPHVGYANFAMGDGSVRSVSETIDFVLYQALSTRRGQEPIGEF